MRVCLWFPGNRCPRRQQLRSAKRIIEPPNQQRTSLPRYRTHRKLTVTHTRLRLNMTFNTARSFAMRMRRTLAVSVLLLGATSGVLEAAGETAVWKPVQFAIVRYNDDAPASWNMFHGEKKGVLLLRLWRRYLLVNVQDQEVFEIDPSTVKLQGENAEWAPSDAPKDAIETTEWKVRDVGPMQRVRFRFGSSGNFLDIQIPRLANGKPAY